MGWRGCPAAHDPGLRYSWSTEVSRHPTKKPPAAGALGHLPIQPHPAQRDNPVDMGGRGVQQVRWRGFLRRGQCREGQLSAQPSGGPPAPSWSPPVRGAEAGEGEVAWPRAGLQGVPGSLLLGPIPGAPAWLCISRSRQPARQPRLFQAPRMQNTGSGRWGLPGTPRVAALWSCLPTTHPGSAGHVIVGGCRQACPRSCQGPPQPRPSVPCFVLGTVHASQMCPTLVHSTSGDCVWAQGVGLGWTPTPVPSSP